MNLRDWRPRNVEEHRLRPHRRPQARAVGVAELRGDPVRPGRQVGRVRHLLVPVGVAQRVAVEVEAPVTRSGAVVRRAGSGLIRQEPPARDRDRDREGVRDQVPELRVVCLQRTHVADRDRRRPRLEDVGRPRPAGDRHGRRDQRERRRRDRAEAARADGGHTGRQHGTRIAPPGSDPVQAGWTEALERLSIGPATR